MLGTSLSVQSSSSSSPDRVTTLGFEVGTDPFEVTPGREVEANLVSFVPGSVSSHSSSSSSLAEGMFEDGEAIAVGLEVRAGPEVDTGSTVGSLGPALGVPLGTSDSSQSSSSEAVEVPSKAAKNPGLERVADGLAELIKEELCEDVTTSDESGESKPNKPPFVEVADAELWDKELWDEECKTRLELEGLLDLGLKKSSNPKSDVEDEAPLRLGAAEEEKMLAVEDGTVDDGTLDEGNSLEESPFNKAKILLSPSDALNAGADEEELELDEELDELDELELLEKSSSNKSVVAGSELVAKKSDKDAGPPEDVVAAAAGAASLAAAAGAGELAAGEAAAATGAAAGAGSDDPKSESRNPLFPLTFSSAATTTDVINTVLNTVVIFMSNCPLF